MAGHDLDESVVVITGASSGIGRATAIAFARRGASLVLAARDGGALANAVAECTAAGGRAIAVPTDMTDPAAVSYLAESAVEAFDRIDVWVNNAGAGAIGAFTETPIEAHDQVIRTNLLGYVHGAYAALPLFQRQQKGILINNISFGAWFPAPYAAAYTASKYGVLGFSEALRAELQDAREIHICNVFPSFINTPGVAGHAANYSGSKVSGAGSAADPFKVAAAIVSVARRPRNTVPVGALASMARLGQSLSPGLSRWLATRLTDASMGSAEPAPSSDGALFETGPDSARKRIYGSDPRPRHNSQLAVFGAAVALGFMASRLLKPKLTRKRGSARSYTAIT